MGLRRELFLGGFDFGPASALRGGDGGAGCRAEKFLLRRTDDGLADGGGFGGGATKRFVDGGKAGLKLGLFSGQGLMQ